MLFDRVIALHDLELRLYPPRILFSSTQQISPNLDN
jgi:hypothetical protein